MKMPVNLLWPYFFLFHKIFCHIILNTSDVIRFISQERLSHNVGIHLMWSGSFHKSVCHIILNTYDGIRFISQECLSHNIEYIWSLMWFVSQVSKSVIYLLLCLITLRTLLFSPFNIYRKHLFGSHFTIRRTKQGQIYWRNDLVLNKIHVL